MDRTRNVPQTSGGGAGRRSRRRARTRSPDEGSLPGGAHRPLSSQDSVPLAHSKSDGALPGLTTQPPRSCSREGRPASLLSLMQDLADLGPEEVRGGAASKHERSRANTTGANADTLRVKAAKRAQTPGSGAETVSASRGGSNPNPWEPARFGQEQTGGMYMQEGNLPHWAARMQQLGVRPRPPCPAHAPSSRPDALLLESHGCSSLVMRPPHYCTVPTTIRWD